MLKFRDYDLKTRSVPFLTFEAHQKKRPANDLLCGTSTQTREMLYKRKEREEKSETGGGGGGGETNERGKKNFAGF